MKNLIAFIALWIGLLIQSTIFEVPPLNLVQPNLVLVVLVVVALKRGARPALILGVTIGLIQDLDYGAFLGLYAFTYGVIGYFAASGFSQFLQRNVAITFLVTVMASMVFEWMTFGFTRLFEVTASDWRMVLAHSLERTILNGICALILYPFLARILTSKSTSRYQNRTEESLP